MRRPMSVLLSAVCALSLSACKPETATPPAGGYDERAGADARRIESDLRFLADDLLEGRETGTRGFDLAALYVAARFRAIGLHPAGDGGSYFQQVPLLRAQRLDNGGSLSIERATGTVALRFRDDFLPQLNFDQAQAQVAAPAAFVGQAVYAPDLDQDDFAGIDLRGKIAVLFNGAPARFDIDRRAFYSSYREKMRALVERGAVGAVIVDTEDEEKSEPWAHEARNWNWPGMRLRDTGGGAIDTFPQLAVVARVSAASAGALLDVGAHRAASLFRDAREGQLRGFDLPGTLSLSAHNRIEPAQSRNVVARLPGADAALGREHVVFTAHLDHLGVGAPVGGDAIYNGALDNALGVAVMLESAQQLAQSATPPRRSLLFVALTGEEKNLLGAEWFAQRPTVPRESLVANINVDMPVMRVPTRDVIAIGVEHSSLQPLLEQAAADIGVELSPDPLPQESIFIRSDQYAFIRAGVPAVFLLGGLKGGEGADRQLKDFLRDHYHEPSDDASQPIQYGDAARLARLNARIGQRIADAPVRPRWNAGDFFGERFGSAERAARP
ncbi:MULTISPECIES: M28 family peptidase [unclassified Lysobacter]|uniref:M28 family peptidase n=1 Tax=unclassified Lysobacter TaxID=2635362 RepID=UPI001BEAA380|nr:MULTISPECIES: M28 family peptidase [unclassified Lysobacter]MBT2750225.1 M28 family peptidase [Lysobacter sp. ISL-50]MBT2775204.1 M28 family peptidase [Lysobacter sp. ISL-54]MBT2782577.1 M28 family peptidase [Lysobacter sp. ISL-52]